MTASPDIPYKCEIEAICYDAICLRGLIEAISQHPQTASLVFGAGPFISLFVMESYDILSSYFPDYRIRFKREYLDLVRASRHRVKMLISSTESINNITDKLGRIDAQHHEYFNQPHKGLLGTVKRLIQPDLGLSTYDGHLFSTTHIIAFNFGSPNGSDDPLSLAELGRMAQGVSGELGAYIGAVHTFFNLPQLDFSKSETRLLGNIVSIDIKARALLNRGAIGAMEPHCPAGLVAILANVNYVLFILRGLMSATLPTLFKLKFLCAYHAEASIRAIQQTQYSRSNPSQEVQEIFKRVLGHSDARWIRKKKELRNFLMHYKLDVRLRNQIAAEAPYSGVIESILGDRTYEEVDKLLDRYLHVLSESLEAGLELTENTFRVSR